MAWGGSASTLEGDGTLQECLHEGLAGYDQHDFGSWPPRSAVTVNLLLVPAPRPVTVAVPVKTTVAPSTLAAVIGPVTYMMLLSKLPLPSVPAGAVGISARQSKRPDPFSKLIPSLVMTGAVKGPPPVRMLVPAP